MTADELVDTIVDMYSPSAVAPIMSPTRVAIADNDDKWRPRASVYFAQIQRQLKIMSASTASRRGVKNVKSNGSGWVFIT